MDQKSLEVLLKDLQSMGKECEWIEFKVNNENLQEIGEYISALSNSACYHNQQFGYIVFGIEDTTHRLIGTNFLPSKTKKGNQEMENWISTQLHPKIDFNIFEFTYDANKFVIIRIDATRDTPVCFRGQAFIRIGSYKKSLFDHPERERKIWNRTKSLAFEKELAKKNVSSDDVLKLIDYPGYFDLIRFPLPDNKKGILEKFVQERIIEELDNGLYNITNLGAILFARNIEVFDSIGRKAVRVIVYQGNNRVKTKKEQIGVRGYAIGFEGLIKYILDQLPTNEVIEKSLRKEVKLFPDLAIRELVANAIIHQDFSINGTSPMIEIFDNRIEITNAGRPLIDPLRFIDHSPQSRNEILARFMRRLNICEERGSGIDKVVFECELYQLPAHDTLVGDNYTRLILYAP